ncbi:MAG TPA: hypothetical protein VMT85_17475 [Thermoanaerobaculia bacterium]|nr:hypothetical protein [Thermoanaerobaculia bacterium]
MALVDPPALAELRGVLLELGEQQDRLQPALDGPRFPSSFRTTSSGNTSATFLGDQAELGVLGSAAAWRW